jgi:hypothetical protein
VITSGDTRRRLEVLDDFGQAGIGWLRARLAHSSMAFWGFPRVCAAGVVVWLRPASFPFRFAGLFN